MLKIDDVVLGFDILEKKFVCDVRKCKGACCIFGDSGAPLEPNEADILKNDFPIIKNFMRSEGIKAIENQGAHIIDSDGDMVTPLVDGKECAYVIFEKNIAKCAIEKAFEAKRINFQKPISCNLYPIRVTRYKDFDALNYHEWKICKPAIKLGEKMQTPLYLYLTQPLIRKYGEAWYDQLKIASEEVVKFMNNQTK